MMTWLTGCLKARPNRVMTKWQTDRQTQRFRFGLLQGRVSDGTICDMGMGMRMIRDWTMGIQTRQRDPVSYLYTH